jgi:hypothetical protein
MNVYQWNELHQLSFDHSVQVFVVGFLAAMFTLWPVCMLFIIPHDVFVANNKIIRAAEKKAAQLEKENDKLRLELIDHIAVIDALLTEKINGQS